MKKDAKPGVSVLQTDISDSQTLNVLLVEDNPTDALILQSTLEDDNINDFKFTHVETLADAVDVLSKAVFDIALVDLGLPDSQGIEIVIELNKVAPELPIIVLTGFDDEEFAIKAVREGAQDYLVKGDIDRPTVLRGIRYAIERKKTEVALRESEDRYRGLFEDSPIPLWEEDFSEIKQLIDSLTASGVKDMREYFDMHPEVIRKCAKLGKVTDVNRATLEYAGAAEKKQLIGDLSSLFREESYDPFRQQLIALASGETTFDTELTVRNLAKTDRFARMSLTIAPGYQQTWAKIFVSFTDLTERRLAEEKIRRQAALLDISQDAIIVRNMDGTVMFWNKGAEKLYGWETKEVNGKNYHEFFNETGTCDETRMGRLIKDLVEWQGEITQFTKSGSRLVVDSRWTLMYDHNDEPASVLIVNTDITEKKEVAKHLLRSQRLESLGTLAGGIAHDLNNVLAPILLSVQILKMKFSDPDIQRVSDTVQSSAQRGAALVKQILTFAKGVDSDRQSLQLKHVIKDVKNMLSETLPDTITVEMNIPNNLNSVTGDPTQLHQVFLNLCVNARDAMPDGGSIMIEAENIELDKNYVAMKKVAEPGPYVAIRVIDTGTGMPLEVIEHIFDPFFTTKDEGKGTGLGLATTHGIIDKHGGFIDVKSKPGRGTKFTVFIPAQLTAGLNETVTQATTIPKGNGECILIVDDEASIREIVKESLEAFGYIALIAENGADAIAKFAAANGRVSVVITDMQMPVMNGPATIPAYKSIKPDIKIIAMSGVQSNVKITAAVRKEINSFLQKPFTAHSLLTTLNDVLTGTD